MFLSASKETKSILRKITFAAFAVTVVFFVIPASTLYSWLGDLDSSFINSVIDYKVVWPTLALALLTPWLLPWQMVVCFVFCVIGDYFGAANEFIGQLVSFTIAQFAICTSFSHIVWPGSMIYGQNKPLTFYVGPISIILALVLFLISLVFFVPNAEDIVSKVGVFVYTVIILCMIILSLAASRATRCPYFVIGGILFVISDFFLALNLFIWPQTGMRLIVCLSYYGSLAFLWNAFQKYRLFK